MRSNCCNYINFEPILKGIAEILVGGGYRSCGPDCPNTLYEVNYTMLSNKDGRFAYHVALNENNDILCNLNKLDYTYYCNTLVNVSFIKNNFLIRRFPDAE